MIKINKFRRGYVALINWVFTAVLAGALVGGVKATFLCLENSYFQDSMQTLAWRFLKLGTSRGALCGLLVALAGLVLFFAAWRVLRVTLGYSRTNIVAAATAVAVIMLFALAAFQLNVKMLPSLLSAQSLSGNAVLVAAAIVVWWGSQKLLTPHQEQVAKLATSSKAMYVLMAVSAVAIGTPITAAKYWRIEVGNERPNVLVILVDALRADRLGSYGYERETSPNIDKVAQHGWLFTNAIAQASFTKPSIASLITGLYARQTSVSSGTWAQQGMGNAVLVRTLSPKHVTLAELFASLGYETAAFGNNHHLLPQLGFAQGYFEYDWEQPPRFGPLNRIVDMFRSEFAATWIDLHFMDWLNAIEDRKFFAYLHHIDVHWPYTSPPPFAGMFTDSPASEDFNRAEFMPETVEKLKSGALTGLRPETVKAMSDAYDEGIRHVDDGLGKVFADLARQGLYDNTLIVITADHGEEFMEHGLLGHGESLYDEVIRVPLIVKFPCPGSYCGQQTLTS